MNDKPTYEELEQKIKDLQNEHLLFKNNLPNIIYIFSTQRGSLYLSPRLLDVLGFEPMEIIQDPMILFDAIHPDDKQIVQNAIESNEKELKSTIEYRIRSKEGKWIWLSDYYLSKTITDDEIIIEGCATDITARKEAELALLESKHFFNDIFEYSPISKWISDENGTLLLLNQACKDMLKLKDEEVVGLYNIFKDNIVESQGYMPLVKDVFEKKANARFTIYYNTSVVEGLSLEKHVTLYLDVSISPIVDRNGKVSNAIIQHIDITKRILAEQALAESEEKFRYLIENMQIGVLLQGPNAEILLSNAKALELLGLSESQLLGKTSFDPDWNVIHEDGSPFPGDTHPVPQAIATRHSVRDVIMGVYRPIPANRVWLLVNAEPQLNEDGSVRQVVCLFIDITEHKLAEEALKESEFALNDIQQKTGLGLWTYDPINRQSIWSKEMYNIWGIDSEPESTLHELHKKYIHPDDYKILELAIKESLELGKPYVLELRICRQDKSERTIISICEPQLDKTGKVFKLKGINQDITERKQIELKIKQQNEALQKLNIDKDRFISILAHDLKNPFNALLGFSELLSTNVYKYDTNKIAKQINIINDITKRTYNLLEDILLWARSQSGKLPFSPREQKISSICKHVIENLELTAKNKNISISYHANEEINVCADKNMMETVLRNLISNAIKFTNKNGHINIYSEKTGSDITVTVSDDGIGIDTDNIKKLFDIAHEISTVGTLNEKGSGIGLLLCKEFVEKHKGTIWVESEKGKGSDFKFRIPINKD